MIKFRRANYCNLKMFLMVLVIYGHWIEPEIENSKLLYTQYWWIYLLHMPMFAFLSGLFLQSSQACAGQIKRLVPYYVTLQLLGTVFSKGRADLLTPIWHLWYLLSFCLWLGAGWLWFRFWEEKKTVHGKGIMGILIVILSVLVACFAGYLPWINRVFSGSRTLVFFPYFFMGILCKTDIPWHKYRFWGMGAMGLVLLVFGMLSPDIPAEFLYHAEGYGDMRHGFELRLLCYLLSGLTGFFVLTIIPQRRFFFTKTGIDTMPVYLLHAPVVAVLRNITIPWWCCACGTVIVYYIIYKISQWRTPLCGIIGGKRRDRMWRNYKKFMKNTASRYTAFYCP